MQSGLKITMTAEDFLLRAPGCIYCWISEVETASQPGSARW
jgi:hypothetical protein